MKTTIDEILMNNQYDVASKLCEEVEILLEKVIENDDALTDLLKSSPQAAALYEKFKDARDDTSAAECRNYYKIGFRFGFRLAMDVFEIR